MKTYRVSFGSNIVGSHDSVIVYGKDENEALAMAKKMLNTHKLIPACLNKYGRYTVVEV